MAQKKTTNKAETEAKAKVKASPTVKKTSEDIQLDAALYIGESLTKVEKGTNWYKRFIDALMDDALKNPNGRCGQLLASTLFNESTLSKLGTEASKAKDDQEEYRIYQLRQTLYKEQQEVFDNQIDRNIIVICSRRAGKTELNARKLIKTALRRNSPCLYLNKTFANAIDQMYDLVTELAGKLDFAIASSSKVDGMIKFTNGSTIKFGGINDIAAIDKYRGFKFRLVIVDEVGHIKNGQYLIDEVLEPATSDFTDSQMVFTGTPPRVKNFATRLWHSKIRKYHWTAIVNPFIHDFQEFIDRKCKEKGITKDDPFIQREYYGNMDAYDTDAVVWKGYKVYKLADLMSNKVEINANQLGHIIFHPTAAYIGVDWGGTDNNAIVSILVDEIGKHAFVYDIWVDKKTGLEVIKAEILKAHNNAISRLQEYGLDDAGKRVHIVTDTNMVEFCVDLCNMHLPVEKAKKYDMMTSVEDMGALLRTGKVLVPDTWTEEDNMLIHDFKNTVYKRDEETDDLMPVIDDDSYHPDAAHALRYAIRAFTGSGTWLNAKATSISATDPTVMPGQENLKEYGPKGAKLLEGDTDFVEEFIL